jgi:hypothetical protein
MGYIIRKDVMEYDKDRVDEMVLALLYLIFKHFGVEEQ